MYQGSKSDELIVNEAEHPIVINAISINTDEKITIFDSRFHGYNALLIENLQYLDLTAEKQYYNSTGNDVFEVFLWAGFSINFEDEYLNPDAIMLSNGEIVNINFLKNNVFDSFGIILKTAFENYIQALELELA